MDAIHCSTIELYDPSLPDTPFRNDTLEKKSKMSGHLVPKQDYAGGCHSLCKSRLSFLLAVGGKHGWEIYDLTSAAHLKIEEIRNVFQNRAAQAHGFTADIPLMHKTWHTQTIFQNVSPPSVPSSMAVKSLATHPLKTCHILRASRFDQTC